MKGPYRIARYPHGEGYEFGLYYVDDKNVWHGVAVDYSFSIIPPQELRTMQAKLNTRVMLDSQFV